MLVSESACIQAPAVQRLTACAKAGLPLGSSSPPKHIQLRAGLQQEQAGRTNGVRQRIVVSQGCVDVVRRQPITRRVCVWDDLALGGHVRQRQQSVQAVRQVGHCSDAGRDQRLTGCICLDRQPVRGLSAKCATGRELGASLGLE